MSVDVLHLVAALQAHVRSLQDDLVTRDALILQQQAQIVALTQRLAERDGDLAIHPSEPLQSES